MRPISVKLCIFTNYPDCCIFCLQIFDKAVFTSALYLNITPCRTRSSTLYMFPEIGCICSHESFDLLKENVYMNEHCVTLHGCAGHVWSVHICPLLSSSVMELQHSSLYDILLMPPEYTGPPYGKGDNSRKI